MEIIELFQKLLRFKSLTPDDDGAFDFIEKYLGSQWTCIKVDIGDTKNRFFYKKFGKAIKGSQNFEHYCFAGHIDVVPLGEGWSVDAFEAKIQNDIIVARGSQDMKSGLAAFLHACKNTKPKDDFDGVLSILLTSDEEGEGTNGTIKVLEHLKEINFLPNYCLVAEPTCEEVFGDSIKIGRRGSINGVLTIKGKQGHAAYPRKCINPVHLFAPILAKIAGHDLDKADEHFEASKIVITDIRAGLEVTNVTPSTCKVMFNVRNCPKTTKEVLDDFLRECLKGLDYDLELRQGSYPFLTNTNSKVIKILEKAIKDILWLETKHSTAGGTSDARHCSAFGIDSIEFGVRNDTIHAVDERVYVKDVEDLNEVFIEFIKNI